MRKLNTCFNVPKHKADTWQTVLTTLADRSLQWGIAIEPQGMVPPPSNAQENTEMDEVPPQGHRIPGCGNAIWLGPEPILGQQDDKANQGLAQQTARATHLVGRRHHAPGGNQKPSRGEGCSTDQPPHIIGSDIEQEQDNASSSTTIPLCGTPHQSAD